LIVTNHFESLRDEISLEGLDARAKRMAWPRVTGGCERRGGCRPFGKRSPERERDALVWGEREQAGNGIFELADVARPRVGAKSLDERRFDVHATHAVPLSVPTDERADERFNVFRPLAKGRNTDWHDV
jgi:hypothetical protein